MPGKVAHRQRGGGCRGEVEAKEKLGAAEKLLMNINRQLCCWPRNNPGLGLGQQMDRGAGNTRQP